MHKLLVIVTLVLITALCGCTTEMGAARGERAVRHAGIEMDSVGILDRSLQSEYSGKIAIEGTGARRTPTDTVEVWSQIRNRTDYPLQIECRVQFFDKDKTPVEGPTAWQRVQLPPQALTVYKQSSLGTDNLNHFYIEIREGR